MKKRLIIFTDCGDTLVDEGTEILDKDGYVIDCALFSGAYEALMALKQEGYRMALVADGYTRSFQNILRQHRLTHAFEALAISEEIGCAKPDPRMFRHAMTQMGLTEADIPHIVMIGNNLKRDIAGANRLGICSILISCSPRYRMQPASADQIPDYVVSHPEELPALLAMLEQQAYHREILTQESDPTAVYKDDEPLSS